MAQRAIAGLDPACRELIVLHTGMKKTFREIAGLLGKSEGALRVQMYRCVRRARDLIREMQIGRERRVGEEGR